jgi:putative hydrolase
MSDPSPFSSGGPFDDLMRNLARMFTAQGPVNWDIARQIAQWTASGGQPDVNADPLARIRLEEWTRVAEMHVAEATGLATSERGWLTARAVSRSEWAMLKLDAWKPMLTQLSTSLGAGEGGLGAMSAEDQAAAPDPLGQLIGNLPTVLGPFLFGVQAGTMVGGLANRAMGQYDLPLPPAEGDELLLVPFNIDAFATDWSLPVDDVRMWVCLREVVHHAVLSRPHVRQTFNDFLLSYVGAFRPDPHALEQHLGQFDPTDMSALQEAFGNPETLLGDMQSDEQRALLVPFQALLSALVGYTDHVLDRVGRRLVGSYGPLTEALRRRRLEEGSGRQVLAKLLGIDVTATTVERGHAFVKGVVERAGEEALGRLWTSPRELPTPAEINAPGLWLARIDLPE